MTMRSKSVTQAKQSLIELLFEDPHVSSGFAGQINGSLLLKLTFSGVIARGGPPSRPCT
jgi:hypothetical protein